MNHATHGFAPDRLDRIGEVLKTRYVDSGAIPGALTLVWRRGAMAHLSLSGIMDLERGTPMRADAIFRIYSMTKPITSVALSDAAGGRQDRAGRSGAPLYSRLREAGRSSPAAIWRAAFSATPARRPMKVIDLMRHTSGLTYGFLNRTNLDAAYAKLGVAEPNTEGGLAGDDRAAGKAAAGILARRRRGIIRSPPMCWAIWWRRFPARVSPISCGGEF